MKSFTQPRLGAGGDLDKSKNLLLFEPASCIVSSLHLGYDMVSNIYSISRYIAFQSDSAKILVLSWTPENAMHDSREMR